MGMDIEGAAVLLIFFFLESWTIVFRMSLHLNLYALNASLWLI